MSKCELNVYLLAVSPEHFDFLWVKEQCQRPTSRNFHCIMELTCIRVPYCDDNGCNCTSTFFVRTYEQHSLWIPPTQLDNVAHAYPPFLSARRKRIRQNLKQKWNMIKSCKAQTQTTRSRMRLILSAVCSREVILVVSSSRRLMF